MLPIISFFGSPTYQLFKHFTSVFKPLTDESRHKLQSTENFIDAINTIQIPYDHLRCQINFYEHTTSNCFDRSKTAVTRSPHQPPLATHDLMDLLHLCLTSTYCQYNGKRYKQLHWTATGYPVSVVAAEIGRQNIEEQALASYSEKLPHWLRYVDDKITAVHKNNIDEFHEHLTKENTSICWAAPLSERYRDSTENYLRNDTGTVILISLIFASTYINSCSHVYS